MRQFAAAVFALLLVVPNALAQCSGQPPFPNTNDINVVMKACTDYGGTWSGGIRGGCTFPPDWCKKGTAAANAASTLPATPTQFFGAVANLWFTSMANKIKEDAARAQQNKLEAAQRVAEQRQRELQKRNAMVQRLTGGDTGTPNELHLVFDDGLGGNRSEKPLAQSGELHLVFDDSALGVKRSAQEPAPASSGYGIKGLPGIYTGGNSEGKGSSAGYGIRGLPGVYLGGAADGDVKLGVDPNSTTRDGYGINGLPAVYTMGGEIAKSSGGYGIPGLPGVNVGGPASVSNGAPTTPQADTESTNVGNSAVVTPGLSVRPEVHNDSVTAENSNSAGTPGAQAPGTSSLSGTNADAPSGAANQQLSMLQGGSAQRLQALAAQQMPGTEEAQSEKARLGFDTAATWGSGPAPARKTATTAVLPAQKPDTAPDPNSASQATRSGAARSGGMPTTQSAPALSAVTAIGRLSPDSPAQRPASPIPQPADSDYARNLAVNRSGIYPPHAEAICQTVQQKHAVAVFQHVNATGRDLVGTGTTTYKPITLKAKSSTMARIPGMVPVNVCFSKWADGIRGELINAEKCIDELAASPSVKDRELARQLAEQQRRIRQCLDAGDCTSKSVNDVDVLADKSGRIFVSDPDPFEFLFQGASGPFADIPGFGYANQAELELSQAVNRAAAQDVIMNGPEVQYGKNGAKFPLTAFVPGDRGCRVIPINNEAELTKFHADMARQGFTIPSRLENAAGAP